MTASSTMHYGLTPLLPCPFCGTTGEGDEQQRGLDAWLIIYYSSAGYHVACGGCGAEHTKNHADKEDAIRVWNTRVTMSPVVTTYHTGKALPGRKATQ